MNNRKTCLVTGGAKRIGRHICKTLAKDGWNVAIHYNKSEKESLELADEIKSLGKDAIAIQADFNTFNEDKLSYQLIKMVEQKLGPIDLLVNNAAVFQFDCPNTTSSSRLNFHITNNLIVPVMLSQALFKSRKKLKSENIPGVIINLLDQKLWNANPDFFSYTLSKAALKEATQLMARTFAPDLRVLGIAPGITLPVEDQKSSDFNIAFRKTPLGYSSTAENIADSVVWLAKANAITGTTLIVDGGQHLVPTPRDVVFMKK
ncbi:MAG: short chain dehydrogenase [Betaproteobacteria bacterium TMED156]|nr:MAG: short chain dehydrogenase [Betaproteobacteria bacterium TMED156]